MAAANFLMNPGEITVNPNLKAELTTYGITDYGNLVPTQLMNFESLLTLKGFIMMVVGGFLVGFGTRYAGGCTSGHAIMGLSNLQWPSLVATICFMIAGFLMANTILPIIHSKYINNDKRNRYASPRYHLYQRKLSLAQMISQFKIFNCQYFIRNCVCES